MRMYKINLKTIFMNRLFRYLMMSVLALCTAGFVSCGDDDDNDDAKSNDVTNGLTGSKTSPAEISGNKWVINWQNSKAYAEMNGMKGETVMEEDGINGLFLTEMKRFHTRFITRARNIFNRWL